MNRMTKYITAFEATKNLVKCITLGHGENADLVTSISSCGIPVCLEGYTVEAIFQPESAWGTENYYEVPCEIVGDVAVVHWSHTQDNGDDRVKIWVNFSKDGEVSYPAMYQLALYVTPGFDPSVIEKIPRVIDFSQISVLNAPWVLPDELSAYATVDSLSAYATNDSLSAYAEKTDLASYLPLTGGTLTGNMTVSGNNNLVHDGTRTETFKNISLANETQSYFTGNPVLNINEKNIDVMVSTHSNNIPAKITGTVAGFVYEYGITFFEPVEYEQGDISGVKWKILPYGGAYDGDYLVFNKTGSTIAVVAGSVFGDQIFNSYYLEDTVVENVPFTANYIYDISEIENGISILETRVDNVDSSKENISNKVASISSSSTNTEYPTAKCVYDGLELRELLANKVTSIDSASTDAQYPTAKCVYDLIGDLETIINAI